MRKPVRACLPDTFTALPKGKRPVISDGCPWQQLKHIQPPKRGGGQKWEEVGGSEPGAGFCPWWEHGLIELACSSSPDTISFLLGTGLCIKPMCSALAKSLKGEEMALSTGHWEGCQVSAPHLPLAPLSSPWSTRVGLAFQHLGSCHWSVWAWGLQRKALSWEFLCLTYSCGTLCVRAALSTSQILAQVIFVCQ